MSRYGQYCPVARAAEILGQRWTMLIIRELLWGNDRFNAIARGVPRMSPSLLSARLRELERVGLVERETVAREARYHLTPAGHELMPLIEQIGAWGQRWMQEILEDEYDPALLMLDIGREINADPARRAPRTSVVQVELAAVPERYRSWWWVFSPDGVDVCDTDPGQVVRAWLGTDPATLTRIWLGQLSWAQAVRDETGRLHGDAATVRELPNWVGVSRFAAIEPAPVPLKRLTTAHR
jgi:DNA-binding HxlR family transcriptional regulator